MKWEALKQRVAAEVRTAIIEGRDYWQRDNDREAGWIGALRMSIGERRPWRECVDVLADAAYTRVMEWDVRCVGTLRDLFPAYFPKSLQKGRLTAYMQDSPSCPWVVEVIK